MLLVSFIFFYLLFRVILFLFQHYKRRKVFSSFPQQPSNFLLGQTLWLLKDRPITHHFIQKLNQIADNFVHKDKLFVAWGATIPTVVMFNKNHVKQILSKNDPNLLNKSDLIYKAIDDIAPGSLLTVGGERWKIRRKILSAPFQATNFDNFVNITNFELLKLTNFLRKNRCEDTLHEMKKFTLLICCKLLFEYDIDDEIEEMCKLVSLTTKILFKKGISIFSLSPALYRFTRLAAEESKMLKGLMTFKNKMLNAKTESSKQSLKSKLETRSDHLNGKSSNFTLIEILLKNFKKNTTNENSAQCPALDMKEIKAQLDTFIVAGLDTTSNALFYLVYHLAKYPNYQEQIYKKIQQVFGEDCKNELSIEEVKKLVFLEAFIRESLRIQPVFPIVGRHVTKDVQLDEKYTIPANTDVVIFIGKLLQDPDYFPEPLVFKPERFLEDQTDNLYADIPFLGGPRNCVAKRITLNIMRFLAVDLIRNFKIEFAESTPREITMSMLQFELVNKPIDKIELKFSVRDSH